MKKRINCEKCDVPMNFHAEKLVDPVNPGEEAFVDPHLGGIVEEYHSCPDCGETTSIRSGKTS
ncbi:MAG: hypothetical protein PHX83_12375 [Acidobacteriia bacterium]|nr:hypothetical protein [Terriglobia bacterium]